MAMYLGSKKVAVTNTVEKQIPSMKAFFEAGGKCAKSESTSFDGIIQYEDTANLENTKNLFADCPYLTTIPQLDTSKVTNMSYMFNYSSKLITVPLFDTSKVTNMRFMFNGCTSLTAIPKMDISKVTDTFYMLNSCYALTHIHMININADLEISSSTKFTREALLEIIGNLKAQTSGTKTLTMGATNLAKLTDEDKAIATNKGWTLA